MHLKKQLIGAKEPLWQLHGNLADKGFARSEIIFSINRIDIFLTVSLIEVERLWKRFQQLGANKNGILTAEKLKDVPVNADVFAKNVS